LNRILERVQVAVRVDHGLNVTRHLNPETIDSHCRAPVLEYALLMSVSANTVPTNMLANSVIAVTNAGHGFGHAVAKALAKAGATVIVVDTNPEAAASVASELEALGAQSIPIKGDFSVQLEVNNTFAKMLELFGSLTGIVHVADGTSSTSFQQLSEGEWSELFEQHARSSYLLARTMARASRNAWGIIVLPPAHNQQPQTRALRGCLSELIAGLAAKGVRINGLIPSRASAGLDLDAPLAQAAVSLAIPSSSAMGGAVINVTLAPAPEARSNVPREFYDLETV
jgi:3-oxoacyl-[acyl-carrier protein] reductase